MALSSRRLSMLSYINDHTLVYYSSKGNLHCCLIDVLHAPMATQFSGASKRCDMRGADILEICHREIMTVNAQYSTVFHSDNGEYEMPSPGGAMVTGLSKLSADFDRRLAAPKNRETRDCGKALMDARGASSVAESRHLVLILVAPAQADD